MTPELLAIRAESRNAEKRSYSDSSHMNYRRGTPEQADVLFQQTRLLTSASASSCIRGTYGSAPIQLMGTPRTLDATKAITILSWSLESVCSGSTP